MPFLHIHILNVILCRIIILQMILFNWNMRCSDCYHQVGASKVLNHSFQTAYSLFHFVKMTLLSYFSQRLRGLKFPPTCVVKFTIVDFSATPVRAPHKCASVTRLASFSMIVAMTTSRIANLQPTGERSSYTGSAWSITNVFGCKPSV